MVREERGAVDPDLAIYSGFPSDADKRLFREVRSSPPEQLGTRQFSFADPRYAELLFRYRARNWPQTLSADEAERWNEFRRMRLIVQTDASALTLPDYFRKSRNCAPQQRRGRSNTPCSTNWKHGETKSRCRTGP